GHMDWKMDSIGVSELLSDLGRTFAPLITLADLTFDVQLDEDLSRVYGDRDRLHQVIANLLNNAMKFTRRGGTIVLRGERLDGEIRISVTDTGIGVASADQERIFEKFQQVGDTLTDKPRGTGLGLAICRDIVEHHQGRLWVDSTPGLGSTFSVALPSENSELLRAA
ncbi:MAG TPA: ATP-binding protein, partial [Chloroflexota bacterium]|nr:ATP-binding protein [Chloroflexota bacterium]